MEQTRNCPYCGSVCHANFVDIGVGEAQCGPYGCDFCHAVQINDYDINNRDNEIFLTEEEKDCGWYKPYYKYWEENKRQDPILI